LTKDAKTDERMILEALRQGQSYISFDYWNDATGFSFTCYDEKSKAYPGGSFTRQGQALLEAKLPGPGIVRLIRDGRVVKEDAKRTALQWDADLPGVYRVEALQHAAGAWRPWITPTPFGLNK